MEEAAGKGKGNHESAPQEGVTGPRLFVRMPAPPFGAGRVQIQLVDTLARLDLLPQIPPDAPKLFVAHGLPVARRAARFLRPFDRGLAHGRREVNRTPMSHGLIVADAETLALQFEQVAERQLS